jgi:nicotinate dehydrogenase subunit A
MKVGFPAPPADAMRTTFSVNGGPCEVATDDRTSLVEHLRDTLNLKGTRYGCGQEQCGACVVLIDGAARPACQVEVGHLHGRAVTTVEALDATPEGRLLLSQFERLQAAQCGFCISGILVRASAFLRESDDGSAGAIARALDGHLCRCGAHSRILAAVAAAWQEWRAAPGTR